MKQDQVNIAVVPDNRRLKNSDSFPLKLRITYKGKRKYYSTGHDVSLEDWEIVNSSGAKGKLRDLKNSIAIVEDDARKFCAEISPFSFYQFEFKFFD